MADRQNWNDVGGSSVPHPRNLGSPTPQVTDHTLGDLPAPMVEDDAQPKFEDWNDVGGSSLPRVQQLERPPAPDEPTDDPDADPGDPPDDDPDDPPIDPPP